MKTLTKFLAFTSLVLAGATAANAQAEDWSGGDVPPQFSSYETVRYNGDGTVTACDPSACFTYWHVGGDTWVIVAVEPKPFPGGRHEN